MYFFSNRLKYREWNTSDAAFLLNLNADDLVIKHTGDAAFKSLAHAEEFILNYDHYKVHGYGRWLVTIKNTNEVIGWAGLKNQIETEGFIDLGFRFLKKEWNKGYGTEAALACLDIGFEKLNMNEIVGRAAKENYGSIKVLQKIGMTEFENDNLCHGLKTRHFKITKSNFLCLKKK